MKDKNKTKESNRESAEPHQKIFRLETAEIRNQTIEGLILFKSIINQSNDAILVIDPETSHFITANDKACSNLGYSHDELMEIGVTDIEAILPDNFSWNEHVKEVKKKGYMVLEGIHKRKNGTTFPVEVNVKFVVVGEKNYMVAIARDITERKESEKNNRILSLVTEQSTASVVITNSNGIIEYVNSKFTEDTGYNPEEVIGKNPRVLKSGVHSSEFYKNLWGTIKSGKVWQNDICNKKKNGELFWELVSISPIKDPEGEVSHFVAVKIDATERKRVEEELKLLQTLTYAIAESKDFISALNITIRKVCESTGWVYGEAWIPYADGTYLEYGNARYCAVKDIEIFAEESKKFKFLPGVGLPGRVWISKKPEWIHDVTLNGNFPRKQLAMEVGLKSAVAIPITADNEVVAILDFMTHKVRKEDERLIGLISTIASQLGIIFKRKQIENLLLQSEAKLKNIMESVPIGIAVSTPEGIIIEANPTLVKILGYNSKDELLKIPSINHYNNINDREKLIKLLQKNNVVKDYEAKFKQKDGTLVWCSLNVIIQRTEKGSQLITTFNDITEHKKLEAQIRHSQKMDALGQLTGGIAHDFNNILTAIMGYANILQIKMRKDDPLRVNADTILESSKKAANLIQNLLAFSRKQLIHLKAVNLKDIIADTSKILARVIREDIELKINLLDKDLTVMADEIQIEQVLINLATNAGDAMPNGGVLTIGAQSVEIDNNFINIYGYGKAGRYGLITVTDTGIGMDENIKKKIFEPFFTTKEVGKGTGLGLAMAYGIIKQHEGYIDLYSKPGKGTTFKIYLPLVKPLQEKIKQEETIKQREDVILIDSGKLILVAEDNEDIRKLIVTALKNYEYTVIEAVDGDDAVEKFKKDKDKINLAILDVIMPKKNGKEVCDVMMKISPDIKVLFMSGYTSDVIEMEDMIEKEVSYISKPFTQTEFLRKIREILS